MRRTPLQLHPHAVSPAAPAYDDGLALIKTRSQPITLSELLPYLLTSLTSHSHVLRSSALQLLSGPRVSRSPEQTDVLSRLVAAEDIPFTVQSVRKRVVKTRKVAVGSAEGEEMREVAVRWLVAQLKINLRPLWAPAIQALGTLGSASGCAEEVWAIVFGELERVCREPESFGLRALEEETGENVEMEMELDQDRNDGAELDRGGYANVVQGQWQEEEGTWRCPRTYVSRTARPGELWDPATAHARWNPFDNG
ncbi:U3 snoRNP protein [Ceratobasidium sp. 414]|nr:U3 snoRNP protein [Ceratobasidium sp. 414]